MKYIYYLGTIMKYTVYQLTSITTGKHYVGYSSKGLSGRLHKHHTNATYGTDTHLYNAIRKYGIDDFETQVLWEGKSKTTALELEKHYIELLGTYVNGYNQTLGGDGGYSVPQEKYDDWLKKKSIAVSGERNPRYSGITDAEILETAYEYYETHKTIPLGHWLRYSKTIGYPQAYTQFRFTEYGGGRTGFKNAMKEVYGLDDTSFKYIKTEEHKMKLAEANRNKL